MGGRGAPFSGNLPFGVVSFGFGLQVQGGGVWTEGSVLIYKNEFFEFQEFLYIRMSSWNSRSSWIINSVFYFGLALAWLGGGGGGAGGGWGGMGG